MATVDLVRSLETPVAWRYGLPAIVVTAGMVNRVTLTLRDTPDATSNKPVEAPSCKFTVNRYPKEDDIILRSSMIAVDSAANSIDLSFKLSDNVRKGYYKWKLVLYNEDSDPYDVYECPFVVDQSINPSTNPYLSIEDIRVELGDLMAEDNKLEDSLEFGAGDIAQGVFRSIRAWNDTTPRISYYLGDTFPYPTLLKYGCVYMLLNALVMFLERRRMQYQSGGTNVDLERRADFYKAKAEDYKNLWMRQMAVLKNEEDKLNFNGNLFYI